MKTISAPKRAAKSESVRKPKIIYPPGYITDPEERRRFAKELRGSIPEIMTQAELQEMRRRS